MSRILITGSSDGLGLMAAQLLAEGGHTVTLHARNDSRAGDALRALPTAEHVVVGDLASIAEMRLVAEQANALGRYDAVIHNAGVGYREPRRVETVDGLAHVFAINVLAPYLLTALMAPPDRLVYLSSGMHRGGVADLDDPQWTHRPWSGAQAYSDSKLSTSCWRLPWHVAGRMSAPTRWSPAGLRPRWAVRGRPTISVSRPSRKHGSRPATTPRRR